MTKYGYANTNDTIAQYNKAGTYAADQCADTNVQICFKKRLCENIKEKTPALEYAGVFSFAEYPGSESNRYNREVTGV